jgi:hypothetical protein
MGEILSKTTMICLHYDKRNDNFDMISNVDSDDSLVYSDDTIYDDDGDEILFKPITTGPHIQKINKFY